MTISMVTISRIRCEHYLEPLGIEEDSPRLSWRFEGEVQNWLQIGYDIHITRCLSNGTSQPTEGYHVDSADSVFIPWPSKPLVSGERAKVQVRSYGQDGSITPWCSLDVEAGLLQPTDWKAVPISCEPQPTDKPRQPFRVRTSFEAPVNANVRLHVTALGLYEMWLNGQRVGDEYLAPGWTSYHERVIYRTFDLTHLVKPGKNTIGGWVNEGWYAGRLAFQGGWRNNYGIRPALIAQVMVNGLPVCCTNATWEWSYGAILTSELQNGEVYDSRISNDWQLGDWKPVEVLPSPSIRIQSSHAPPVRAVCHLKPVEIITTPSGAIILDFGQNFSGVIRILRPPSQSQELVFRHAEVLEHGELGIRPLRHAAATDRVICGGPLVGWEPKFTSHGFRYVQVNGWPEITLGDIIGVVFHSAMERTGHFSCSHPLINRLHQNVVWSTIGNTISIPTDCPQRDERLGWTGDIQVFSPTLNFLFDSAGFLQNWLQDVYIDQKRLGGNVPVTVPDILDDAHNQRLAIWGDVSVLTPFDFFTSFADTKLLRDQYHSGKMWLEKGVVRDRETGLWNPDQHQLSDWLAPQAPPESPADAPTDSLLVADIYLIHTTRTMSKIAKSIDLVAEAAKYDAEADRMTQAFLNEYVTPNGRVMSDTQTALALLIVFNIITPPLNAEKLGMRLGKLVENEGWKVSTGFAGTPVILHALANSGQLHHAYRMLQGSECPSWLSPILLGATTIWERWDSMLGDGTINPGEMTSFNHYALGSVASFLHSVVGGISPLLPGWKKILIRPQPGGTITSASVSFISPYGKIACDWRIEGNKLEVDVEVPPNTTAQVDLPGVSQMVGSGKRHYTVGWEADTRFPPKQKFKPYTHIPSLVWQP